MYKVDVLNEFIGIGKGKIVFIYFYNGLFVGEYGVSLLGCKY